MTIVTADRPDGSRTVRAPPCNSVSWASSVRVVGVPCVPYM